MKKPPIILSFVVLMLFTGCEAFRRTQPIPTDKKSFVGVWISSSGFKLHIKAAGTASITQDPNAKEPDFGALNIKVAPPMIEEICAEFISDSVLTLAKPLNYAKDYRIDRFPYRDGDITKMVLNGVTLFKER